MPYYDRAGQPLTMDQWAALIEDRDRDYHRVALDTVGEAIVVSTVWLGLDHSFGAPGPPLIFETMVFDAAAFHGTDMHAGAHADMDMECRRYATEAEALAGHAAMVALFRETAAGAYDVEDLR